MAIIILKSEALQDIKPQKGRERMKKENEKGSYTIEACISLLAFLIAIYVVFLQINTMVAECVLQKAVDNVAVEISSFSYILKRVGIIPEHDDSEMSSTINAINSGKEAYQNFSSTADDISGFVGGLFENPRGAAEDINNLGASLGSFVQALKNVDWKEDLISTARYATENVVKKSINTALDYFYSSRIKNGMYLPVKYEDFRSIYHVDDISVTINFMPTAKNNTVLVYVKCSVNSPIKFPGLKKREVVKVAYSPLWVK